MPLQSFPAVFMRGGTSRAIMFHARDLPDRSEWDPIFLAAMGSPDPNGRQLDGMGGGVSSLSKVCVLVPSTRDDADVDYTFAQVQIRQAAVDYRGNCGNMSSAVGPFAVDEGLLRPNGDTATVRVFNTNTSRIIRAHFPLEDGRAATTGSLAIPGVAGASPLEVSLVDAANACVFVRAADLGLRGDELPDGLEANPAVLDLMQRIRRAASVAMGIAGTDEEAARINGVPFVGFVAPAMEAATLSGDPIRREGVDLTVRFLSNGQPHRALPLTASLCTAIAARIEGTVVHEMLGRAPEGAIRLGMPSGVLTVDADVGHDTAGKWEARSGAFYRTARRLFDGRIYVPR